jgi:2-polyprenyl-3-methyl-5-hydroxy-6-metoxy-1,4-benzoquinol methylase
MAFGYEEKPHEYFHSMRPELEALVPSGIRTFLDIGCARGFFAARVKKKHKAEVWGVELMPEPAVEASAVLDNVLVGDVVQLLAQIPDRYFDCIALNDVLEHVVDPWDLLASLRTKLSGNGVVIASIPNVRYIVNLYQLLVEADWRYCEEGVLDRTHLRFFTRKSMRRLFTETGFEVITIQGAHATPSWKAKLVVILSLGLARDTRFLQFSIVARPAR